MCLLPTVLSLRWGALKKCFLSWKYLIHSLDSDPVVGRGLFLNTEGQKLALVGAVDPWKSPTYRFSNLVLGKHGSKNCYHFCSD